MGPCQLGLFYDFLSLPGDPARFIHYVSLYQSMKERWNCKFIPGGESQKSLLPLSQTGFDSSLASEELTIPKRCKIGKYEMSYRDSFSWNKHINLTWEFTVLRQRYFLSRLAQNNQKIKWTFWLSSYSKHSLSQQHPKPFIGIQLRCFNRSTEKWLSSQRLQRAWEISLLLSNTKKTSSPIPSDRKIQTWRIPHCK